MGKQKNRFSFDSSDLFIYIWSKRKPLLWIAVLAIIISLGCSYLIKPKFKSTVVMFPASSASISKSIFNNGASKEDILKFGGQEEGEQLMQILLSTQIRDRIIQEFNLVKHYKIDTSARYWKSNLYGEYKENITFRRTELMSVVIDVVDNSPDTAARIANEISNLIDSVMDHVQHERALMSFKIVEREHNDLQNQIEMIQDSIKKINELSIIGFGKNAVAYHKAYANSIVQEKTQGVKILENKLKLIGKYGGTFTMLNNLLDYQIHRLSDLNETYMEAKIDAEHAISHKFIIDKAYASDKKDSPKRILIVLVSTLASLLFALLVIVIQDSINNKKV